MSSKNGSSSLNGTKMSVPFSDHVPLSSLDKVIPLSVVLGVLFLVSVIGNALVCIVIIKRKDMRGVTNLLLFNMALSDLLSTVFFVPWAIAKEISPISWPLGDFMCRAPPVIASVSVSVSVYSMLALAVERYQAVVSPFNFRASRDSHRRAFLLMIGIWLVGCAIATPQAVVITTLEIPPVTYCLEDWSGSGGEEGSRAYIVVIFVVLFAIPLVVICGSYSVIMRKLWQPDNFMAAQSKSQDTRFEEQGSPNKLKIHGANMKRKTTYMLITVIVVFMICMLPFQILVLVAHFRLDLVLSEAFSISAKVAVVLATCSMASNPFIYSFFSEKFRRAFADVFKCRCDDEGQLESTQRKSSIVLLSSTTLPT